VLESLGFLLPGQVGLYLLLIPDWVKDGKVESITAEGNVSRPGRYCRPIFDIFDLLLELDVLLLISYLKLSLMINEEAADHILAEELIFACFIPSPSIPRTWAGPTSEWGSEWPTTTSTILGKRRFLIQVLF
jgi:hypothetical protein